MKIKYLQANNSIIIKYIHLILYNRVVLSMIVKLAFTFEIQCFYSMQIQCSHGCKRSLIQILQDVSNKTKKTKYKHVYEGSNLLQQYREDPEIRFYVSIIDIFLRKMKTNKSWNAFKIRRNSLIFKKMLECLIKRIHLLNLEKNTEGIECSEIEDYILTDNLDTGDVKYFEGNIDFIIPSLIIPKYRITEIYINIISSISQYENYLSEKVDYDGIIDKSVYKLGSTVIFNSDLSQTTEISQVETVDILKIIHQNTKWMRSMPIIKSFNNSESISIDTIKKHSLLIPSTCDEAMIFLKEAATINDRRTKFIPDKLLEFSEFGRETIYSTYKFIKFLELHVLYIVDLYLHAFKAPNELNWNLNEKHGEIFKKSRTKGEFIACYKGYLSNFTDLYQSICIITDIITAILNSCPLSNFSDCCLLIWKIDYITMYLIQLENNIEHEISKYKNRMEINLYYGIKKHKCISSLKDRINKMLMDISRNINIYYSNEFSEIMKREIGYLIFLKELHTPYNPLWFKNKKKCSFKKFRNKLENLLIIIQTNLLLNYVYIRIQLSTERDIFITDKKCNVKAIYKNEINILYYCINYEIPLQFTVDPSMHYNIYRQIEMEDILRDLSCFKYIFVFDTIQKNDNKRYKLQILGIEILFFIVSHDIIILLETICEKIHSRKFIIDNLWTLLIEIHTFFIKVSNFANIIKEMAIVINAITEERISHLLGKVTKTYQESILGLIKITIHEKNYEIKIINLKKILVHAINFYKSTDSYISYHNTADELEKRSIYAKDFKQIIKSINCEIFKFIRLTFDHGLKLSYHIRCSLEELVLFCMEKGNNFDDIETIIIKKKDDLVKQMKHFKRNVNKEAAEKPYQLYDIWQTNMKELVGKIYDIYEIFKYLTLDGTYSLKAKEFEYFWDSFCLIEELDTIYPPELFSKRFQTIYWLGIQYYQINFIIHIFVPFIAALYRHCITHHYIKEAHEVQVTIASNMKKTKDLLFAMCGAVKNDFLYYIPIGLFDHKHESKYYDITELINFICMEKNYYLKLTDGYLYTYKFHLLFFKMFFSTIYEQNKTYMENMNLIFEQIYILLASPNNKLYISSQLFKRLALKRLYKSIKWVFYNKFVLSSIEVKMTQEITAICIGEFQDCLNGDFTEQKIHVMKGMYIDYVYVLDSVLRKIKYLIQNMEFLLKAIDEITFNENNFHNLFICHIKYFMLSWKELEETVNIFSNDKQGIKFDPKLGHDINKDHRSKYFKDNNNPVNVNKKDKILNYFVAFYMNINTLNNRKEKLDNPVKKHELTKTFHLCLLKGSNICSYHHLIVKKVLDSMNATLDTLTFLSEKMVNENVSIYIASDINNFSLFSSNCPYEYMKHYSDFKIIHEFLNKNVYYMPIIFYFDHQSVIKYEENNVDFDIIELTQFNTIISFLHKLLNKKFQYEIAYFVLFNLMYPLCHIRGINLSGFKHQIIYVGKELIEALCEHEMDI